MRKYVLLAGAALFFGGTATAAPVTYGGSQSTIQYNLPYSNGCACWSGTQYINGTKVIYDSATDTYTVRDTGNASTTSTFTGGVAGVDYTTYTKTSGSVTETLTVLNKANSIVPLTYVTYGHWRRTGLTGLYPNNDTFIVFGDKTLRTAMPVSGTANYTTLYDGSFVNKDGVFVVGGSGTMTANFATGTVGYSVSLTGTPEAAGSNIAFGSWTGSGSIANGGPAFTTPANTNGNGYTLQQWGNFYGPAADEVGGNFSLRGSTAATRGSGTGAFVGN